MILVPFLLIAVTLYLLIHNILEKYYALLFAESTTHVFKCRACQKTFSLSGTEAKELIRPNWLIVFPKKKCFTFICPECQVKGQLEKIKTIYRN